MGHYENSYEQEQKKREEKRQAAKQELVANIEAALDTLGYFEGHNPVVNIIFQKLKEARMWSEEI